jgi:outer membrane protein TolC
VALPHIAAMEEYALRNRPEILIASTKIQQYNDALRLEKAKIFKEVDIGVSYKQDFDRPFAGWGPYFNLSLPIFDDNHAQIARAEFLLKQAEQELVATKIKILEEINKSFTELAALEQEIERYENMILPAHEQAIDYAYTYASSMQLSMTTALQAEIKFYEDYARLLDTYYHALKVRASLERALSQDIALFSVP